MNYAMFPEENSFYLLQQSNARRNGALPNTLKAHQLNKTYKNKYLFQQNYNQAFGDPCATEAAFNAQMSRDTSDNNFVYG